ncbi:MAG: hypothetical protein UR66_C0006G0001, partial [Candidatus Moranbacteria bacterium GW2011_GWE1_35_17]
LIIDYLIYIEGEDYGINDRGKKGYYR